MWPYLSSGLQGESVVGQCGRASATISARPRLRRIDLVWCRDVAEAIAGTPASSELALINAFGTFGVNGFGIGTGLASGIMISAPVS